VWRTAESLKVVAWGGGGRTERVRACVRTVLCVRAAHTPHECVWERCARAPAFLDAPTCWPRAHCCRRGGGFLRTYVRTTPARISTRLGARACSIDGRANDVYERGGFFSTLLQYPTRRPHPSASAMWRKQPRPPLLRAIASNVAPFKRLRTHKFSYRHRASSLTHLPTCTYLCLLLYVYYRHDCCASLTSRFFRLRARRSPRGWSRWRFSSSSRFFCLAQTTVVLLLWKWHALRHLQARSCLVRDGHSAYACILRRPITSAFPFRKRFFSTKYFITRRSDVARSTTSRHQNIIRNRALINLKSVLSLCVWQSNSNAHAYNFQ